MLVVVFGKSVFLSTFFLPIENKWHIKEWLGGEGGGRREEEEVVSSIPGGAGYPASK